jgi:toxin-antitoxin system PIN domain toxin
MKTLDVHVLLYAINSDSPQFAAARSWIESSFAQPAGLGFAWPVLVGFLRLSTRSGIFAQPLSVERALAHVDCWLDHPNAHLLQPTTRHRAVLSSLLLCAGKGGNLTSDAHLAAIAIEHGAELGTFDRDFEQYAGLRMKLLK